MPVKRLWVGKRFIIEAWVEDNCCELEEFLQRLKFRSRPGWKRIISLIAAAAERISLQNEEQCCTHSGEFAEDLFEFKTRGGISVFWFYGRESIIVCSHGIITRNKNTLPDELRKAGLIKEQYFNEKYNEEAK